MPESLAGKTISIGVLMFPYFQLLDAAGPVDYLNSHSKTLLSLYQMPEPIVKQAPILQWHWISHDLNPITPSSGPSWTPTCTYATAPHLDYILVPGPDPMIVLPDGCADFLKTRFPLLKGLLTVCTGSMAISSTGILDGLQVCTNKAAMKGVAKEGNLRKNVKWVRDRRWIIDGKVWSAAGITAGLDLAAEFARVHFEADVCELVMALSEYTPKPDRPDDWAKLLDGVDLGLKD